MTEKNKEAAQSLKDSKTYHDTIGEIAMDDAQNGFNTVQYLQEKADNTPEMTAAILREINIQRTVNPNMKFDKQDIQALEQRSDIKETAEIYAKVSASQLGFTLDKELEDFKAITYDQTLADKQQTAVSPSEIDYNNPWINDAVFEFGEAFDTFDDKRINMALQNPTLTIAASQAKKERPEWTYEELIKDSNIIEFGKNLEKNGHKNKAETIENDANFKEFLEQNQATQIKTQEKISIADIMTNRISDYLTPGN